MSDEPAKQDANSRRMDEFASLLGRHQRQIYLYILSILPQPTDAEDVLQDTNVVLWGKFEQYQPGTLFATWACSIAHYKVLQHLQKNRRRPVLVDADLLSQLARESAECSAELEAEQQWLTKCLAKLPPEDRKLILRRYEPGATGKSVAESLGRPANSVCKSLSRIRRSLLKCVRHAANEDQQP